MSEGKILIMGTGGCGSGFIWHMLKRCGLETTEHREWIRQGGIIRSKDPANFPAPKVIKHLGGFLTNLNKHLDTYGWEVDHIFFPVAVLELQMRTQKRRLQDRGLTFDFETELVRYHEKLGRGMEQLIAREHPFTIISCPRSITDPQYLYDKMKVVLGDLTYEEFKKHHASTIIPKYRARLDYYSRPGKDDWKM